MMIVFKEAATASVTSLTEMLGVLHPISTFITDETLRINLQRLLIYSNRSNANSSRVEGMHTVCSKYHILLYINIIYINI